MEDSSDPSLEDKKTIIPKPFLCPYCGRGFKLNPDLKRHIRSHTGEKPFVCGYCFKKFTRKAHAQDHLKIHTGVKPHKCDYCCKQFTRKSHLTGHLRTHGESKTFSCGECSMEFSRKSQLNKHLKVHSTNCVLEEPHLVEKMYCSYCEKTFANKYTYKTHLTNKRHTYMLTHPQKNYSKTFFCADCNRNFHLDTTLRIHIQKVHMQFL